LLSSAPTVAWWLPPDVSKLTLGAIGDRDGELSDMIR